MYRTPPKSPLDATVPATPASDGDYTLERLKTSATVIIDHCEFVGVDPERGAFMAPTLLQATDKRADAIHQVEAFGPVSTVIGYDSVDEAVELAALGRGSLVASVFTDDPVEAATLTLALGSHHGRIQVVDETSLESHTGHGAPLPNLVHGQALGQPYRGRNDDRVPAVQDSRSHEQDKGHRAACGGIEPMQGAVGHACCQDQRCHVKHHLHRYRFLLWLPE